MHSRSSPDGDPYSYNFTLPEINVGPGIYEINYQLFYLCDGVESDCRNVNDKITITINERVDVYDFDQLTNNPTWVKKTIIHTSYWPAIQFVVNLSRGGTKADLYSYLAFDDLEIYRIGTVTTTTESVQPSTEMSTTSQEPITSTLSPYTIFYCNFDSNNCGGTPYPDFSTSIISYIFNILNYITTYPSLSLSDFTSICKLFFVVLLCFNFNVYFYLFNFFNEIAAKPTKNGYKCEIPYFFNNKMQYHCQARTEFDCQTLNTSFAMCLPGKN